jgi:hypothetical protein
VEKDNIGRGMNIQGKIRKYKKSNGKAEFVGSSFYCSKSKRHIGFILLYSVCICPQKAKVLK